MTPKPTLRGEKLWKTIGFNVQNARLASHMGATEFALRAQITRQALNLIERGAKGARIETLYRIAKACNRPITDFLPPVEEV